MSFMIDQLNSISVFALDKQDKIKITLPILKKLTEFHYANCPYYKKMIDFSPLNFGIEKLEKMPFFPVRLFKEYELFSVERDSIRKIMTSSGTSNSVPSKIFLDAATASAQTKVLSRIMTSYIGPKRLPMLIIDSKSVISNRNSFSARGAGILGFSMFGHDVTYALNDSFELEEDILINFLKKYQGKDILLFGFTFMVWQSLVKNPKIANDNKIDLSRAILIHGGGWKKMIDESVDNFTFRKTLFEKYGLSRIYNYYGLVEQTGSIYMECEKGHLHCSIYSDILIRDYQDFSVVPNGKEGLIQVISLLSLSYPGHSLLTEDIGVIHGEDDCPCGRKGKYFSVKGRIKNAEVRGCSDTVKS